MYIGIASDTIVGSNKGGIQISSSGYHWARTIQYPYGHSDTNKLGFSNIRSVGGRLFLTTGRYISSYNYYRQLCVMNSNARSYSIVRVTDNSLPSLYAMIYVEKLGQYLHFGDNVIYSSPDGFQWKAVAQTGFSGTKSSAIYIEGDGFYVTVAGSYGSSSILYAPYP